MVVLFEAGHWLHSVLPEVSERVEGLGALAPFAFILICATAGEAEPRLAALVRGVLARLDAQRHAT